MAHSLSQPAACALFFQYPIYWSCITIWCNNLLCSDLSHTPCQNLKRLSQKLSTVSLPPWLGTWVCRWRSEPSACACISDAGGFSCQLLFHRLFLKWIHNFLLSKRRCTSPVFHVHLFQNKSPSLGSKVRDPCWAFWCYSVKQFLLLSLF